MCVHRSLDRPTISIHHPTPRIHTQGYTHPPTHPSLAAPPFSTSVAGAPPSSTSAIFSSVPAATPAPLLMLFDPPRPGGVWCVGGSVRLGQCCGRGRGSSKRRHTMGVSRFDRLSSSATNLAPVDSIQNKSRWKRHADRPDPSVPINQSISRSIDRFPSMAGPDQDSSSSRRAG